MFIFVFERIGHQGLQDGEDDPRRARGAARDAEREHRVREHDPVREAEARRPEEVQHLGTPTELEATSNHLRKQPGWCPAFHIFAYSIQVLSIAKLHPKLLPRLKKSLASTEE